MRAVDVEKKLTLTTPFKEKIAQENLPCSNTIPPPRNKSFLEFAHASTKHYRRGGGRAGDIINVPVASLNTL